MSKVSKIIIFSTILMLFTFFDCILLNKVEAREAEGLYCLFCDTAEEEAKKEKQFSNKIKIIKRIFGDKIDEATLASTVLYTNFDAGVDRYYKKDFDSSAFSTSWKSLSGDFSKAGNTENGEYGKSEEESDDQINNTSIDLLTAATIVMVLSNGFDSPYSEEAYKKALMLDKGFTDGKINALFCNPIASSLIFSYGSIKSLNPFDGSDYSIVDAIRYVTTFGNICEHGFLEATYKSVSGIEDEKKRKKAKEDVADSIIEIAKMYKPWFGEDDSCVYGGSVGEGEATNWRQFPVSGQDWANLTLGPGGDTVHASGCTSVSMAYLINKSGTALSVKNFDPGVFVKNVEYDGASCLSWSSLTNVAPNWVTLERDVPLPGNETAQAKIISGILNEPSASGNQRFVVLQTAGHWVAVDHVEENVIYVMDPAGPEGAGLIPLSQAWGAPAFAYNVFEATDVPFGKSNKKSNKGSAATLSSTEVNYNSSDYKNRLDNLNDYLQCGPKLRDTPLGNSSVCSSGCMVASLASINYMFTGVPTDVPKLIEDMIKEGEWSNAAAGMGTPYFDSPDNSPLLTEKWGLSGETLNSPDKNTIKENVIKKLKEGKKILLNLGGGVNNYSTEGGHFLMIDHYDSGSKKIYIFNPAGTGTGYITEEQLMDEVLAYNKYGPWAISSNSVNMGNNFCETPSEGDLSDLMTFLANLEGVTECNYKGKGEGTGYVSSNHLNDGAGMTTAFGITEYYCQDAAKEVGYTNFLSDIRSGCTDKNYIDKMYPVVLEDKLNEVENDFKDMNLKNYQKYILTSILYNTGSGGSYRSIKGKIIDYGIDSFEVFDCMKTIGCGWTAAHSDGLANRRMAEYEVLMTGNFNVTNAGRGYAYYANINTEKQWKDYMAENFRTNGSN